MPLSRPMPSIGPNVHELRINDGDQTWRVISRIGTVEILVVLVFAKTTRKTPKSMIDLARRTIRQFDAR